MASDHTQGNRQGEEIKKKEGQEPGRHDHSETGAGRPSGTRKSRDATSINPQDPIDPDSPDIPPA